jgi:hypothetical protein
VAAQLNLTHPTRSFNEMVQSRMDEYAGNALYRKVINDVKEEFTVFKSIKDPTFCFVAGTLIHTKEGLVPIEQIKVGDWVLSQPEAQGELAYKRVVNTFRFEDKTVYSIDFSLDKPKTVDDVGGVVVTGNHPLWVKGRGWTRADQVGKGDWLKLADGREVWVFSAEPVYRTETEGLGWIHDGTGAAFTDTGRGRLIDFRDGRIHTDYTYATGGAPWKLEGSEYRSEGTLLRVPVYNIEVEEFHTYYASTLGVWVHNTHCGGDRGTAQEIRQGSKEKVIPFRSVPIYEQSQTNRLPAPYEGIIREI